MQLLKYINSKLIKPKTFPLTRDSAGNCGVLLIAFGNKYVSEAVHCAKSIKKYSKLKIAICYDNMAIESEEGVFDHKIQIIPNHVRTKVDFLEITPFDYTLYLDSDTEVTEDISEIFKLLNKFDVCMTHDFARKRLRWTKLIAEYEEIPDGYSEFGGGVILYKKDAKSFLENWKHYFYKYYDVTNGWDQASLRIASWHCTNSIYVLPVEFNVRGQHNREKVDRLVELEGAENVLRPRILHWHGLNDPSCKIKPYKF